MIMRGPAHITTVKVSINNTVVATATTLCITGVTRNPNNAKAAAFQTIPTAPGASWRVTRLAGAGSARFPRDMYGAIQAHGDGSSTPGSLVLVGHGLKYLGEPSIHDLVDEGLRRGSQSSGIAVGWEFPSCRVSRVTCKNGSRSTSGSAPRRSHPQKWAGLCDTTPLVGSAAHALGAVIPPTV
jgi:hypothetical protein